MGMVALARGDEITAVGALGHDRQTFDIVEQTHAIDLRHRRRLCRPGGARVETPDAHILFGDIQPAGPIVGDAAFGLTGETQCPNEPALWCGALQIERSEEHTSELQSLMRRSYAVFCLKKKKD